jgi:hypothetical protein
MSKTTIIILMAIALGVMTLIATKQQFKVKTVVITERHDDTLYIEQLADTVFLDKVRYISKPIHDTVYVNQEGDSIANYSGEFFVDSTVTVIYNIDVKGMIQGFNFGAVKNYPPQEVITKTITNIVTEYQSMEYKALWAVLGMDIMGNPTIGLDFQNHNKVFGINFNPIDKVIGFNYKLRLFKK